MIMERLAAIGRRLGLRASKWVERRLAEMPRGQLKWMLVMLAVVAAAWFVLVLGGALYQIFNHH